MPPAPLATQAPFVHVWAAEQQTAAAPTPHFLAGSTQVMLHSNLAAVETASQIGVGFDPAFVESLQGTQLIPQLSTDPFARQTGVPVESAVHLWKPSPHVNVQDVPLQPTTPLVRVAGIQGVQLLPQVRTSLFDLQVGSSVVPPHAWKLDDLQTLRHVPVVVQVAMLFLSAAGGGQVAQVGPH